MEELKDHGKTTPKHLIMNMYRYQKRFSSKKGFLLSHTLQELEEWLYTQGFEKLYEKWISEKLDEKYKPTIAKNKNTEAFLFSNMKLTTLFEKEELLKSITEKKCYICKKVKKLGDFNKKKTTKDGYKHECRECSKQGFQEYYRTEKGVFKTLYKSQKHHSKHRGYEKPSYSISEFEEWLYKNNYKKLYDDWVKSDYDKDTKPSVDRLDDYKSYTFDNIRLITWGENRESLSEDMTQGLNNKQSRSILQYTKDNVFVKEYYSIHEAARQIKGSPGTLHNCCTGKQITGYGFKWKFKHKESIKHKHNLQE